MTVEAGGSNPVKHTRKEVYQTSVKNGKAFSWFSGSAGIHCSSIRTAGAADIEGHEAEKFLVAQLRQQGFAFLVEQLIGQGPFVPDHGVDAFFHRAAADELVDQHIPFLANAKRSIRGLVLDRGIPPAIEVHHVRSGGQVQPAAPGLERDHKERRASVLLKLIDKLGAPANRRAAVQYQPGPAEHSCQKIGQWLGERLKLREDQHLFLALGDRLAHELEAIELAAVLRRKCCVPEVL